MTPDRTARVVHDMTLDALTIKARYVAALDLLEQSVGGYPASVVGAAPPSGEGPLHDRCPRCGGTGSGTGNELLRKHLHCENCGGSGIVQVERTTRGDAAVRDLDRFREHLRTASHHIAALAAIVNANWIPGTEAGRHADALNRATVLNDACTNHGAHGIYEPRGEHGRGGMCAWCYRIAHEHDDHGQVRYGEPPDATLIDQHHRRGRLSSMDFIAFSIRIQERRRKRTKAKKASAA